MSDDAKQEITLQALGLLNEQVEARIIHYKGDLETSPELDAVTAEVVAQLKQMQAALAPQRDQRSAADIEKCEADQTNTLAALLTRAFAKDEQGSLITANLRTIGRRIAKLFFESELHEKTKGDKDKVIHLPEQGVFYVLQRYKRRLQAELEGFEYLNEEAEKGTLELLNKIERDLQVGFLSRRSPELNRVMGIFTSVLVDFCQKHMPPRLSAMAKNTIRAAETARQDNSVSYKIHADRFPQLRTHWERMFLEQMVNYCGDELFLRLRADESDEVREETIKFFTDPHMYSETSRVICSALYDYLCLEGLLDLPLDWRVSMTAEEGVAGPS